MPRKTLHLVPLLISAACLVSCADDFEASECEEQLPHGSFTRITDLEYEDVTERERALVYPSVNEIFDEYKFQIDLAKKEHEPDNRNDAIIASLSARAQLELRQSFAEIDEKSLRDAIERRLGFNALDLTDDQLRARAKRQYDDQQNERADYLKVYSVEYNREQMPEKEVLAASSEIYDTYDTISGITSYGYTGALCFVNRSTSTCSCDSRNFYDIEEYLKRDGRSFD